jgi:general secretion pathway protein G
MASHREPIVFFPWERRHGVRSLFIRARARQVLLVVLALAAFAWLRARQRHVSQVRATRATITTTIDAIGAWRADHEQACPGSPTDLVSGGYLSEVPRDAWGHPLRITCPGRKDPKGFDVASDGPDGLPGGLDRVE